VKKSNEEYLFEKTGDTSQWTPIRNLEESEECIELTRPKYSVIAIIIDLVIPWAILVIISEKCLHLRFSENWIPLTALYIILRLKQISLWLILLYQRFAAWHLREACLFEPTCSQYTFLSIQKYGIVAGTVKGIQRLLRCKPPNGGKDFP